MGLLAVVSSAPAEAVGEDSGGVFVPVTPTRIVDTATGVGGYSTPFGAGTTRSFTVLGIAGVPTTDVGAVVVDVAVKSATATGSSSLKVWTSGESMPSPTTMFYTAANAPRSNTSVVKPGSDGKISIYNSSGTTNVDVDIQGYFTIASDESSAGGFVPIAPKRVASTYDGVGVPVGQQAVGVSRDIQIANGDEIPDDATAVFANVDVTSTATSGYLSIVKGGQSATGVPPTANYQDSGPTSTGVILPLSVDGQVRVLNAAGGPVSYRIDVQGYFSGDSAAGGSYHALTPANIYLSTSAPHTELAAHETRTIDVAGVAGIPDDGTVGSAIVSLTAVGWTSGGTLSVYNADDEPPGPYNLNFQPGIGGVASTTTAIVELSDEGTVKVRNTSTAAVDFYLTAQGWFGSEYDPNVEGLPDPTVYDPADDPDYLAELPTVALLDAVQGAFEDVAEGNITFAALQPILDAATDTLGFDVSDIVPNPFEDHGVHPAVCTQATNSCGSSDVVATKHYSQVKSYYCGPTSMEIILNAMHQRTGALGGSFSQSTFASSKYLNTNGVGSTDMKQLDIGLDLWIPGPGKFIAKPHPTVANFKSYLLTNISGDKPFAVGTFESKKTSGNPNPIRYNYHPSYIGQSDIRHWIVAYGYAASRGTTYFDDPAYGWWHNRTFGGQKVVNIAATFSYNTTSFVNTFVKPHYGVVK